MIRKCFTVNPHRTIEEINSYEVLLKENPEEAKRFQERAYIPEG
jgi:hypothetical protein